MSKPIPQHPSNMDSESDKPALLAAFYTRTNSGIFQPSHKVRHSMTKVPEVTLYFWIIKVLTTGMGETTSDYLVHLFNPIIVVALASIVLTASLLLQFAVRRYVTWIYWLAVVMVSVFGTMAADVLHIQFGIPYLVSTIFFTVTLAIIFVAWYLTEKTLSIHSIYTRRREMFYWATILTTFALGTATGDMTAITMHLGYLSSGILFAVLIAIPAIAHYVIKSVLAAEHRYQSTNAVLAFWLAYILTRPLGASFADWMGVSHARGGLAWGTGMVSMGLLIIIIGFVGYLAVSHKDTEKHAGLEVIK